MKRVRSLSGWFFVLGGLALALRVGPYAIDVCFFGGSGDPGAVIVSPAITIFALLHAAAGAAWLFGKRGSGELMTGLAGLDLAVTSIFTLWCLFALELGLAVLLLWLAFAQWLVLFSVRDFDRRRVSSAAS